MWKDKIVEKVRKNREKVYSRFDFDIDKYFNHIFEEQSKRKEKKVSLSRTQKAN